MVESATQATFAIKTKTMSNYKIDISREINESYDIEIGHSLLSSLVHDIAGKLVSGVSKYILISDSVVSELYANNILAEVRGLNVNAELLVFPNGEANKTRSTKALLEDQLISMGCNRDICIIAIGGGVVSDLAGFLAGTYARGVPYIIYSTTLLAAADASVGGKTAIDTPDATNLIGMFYQPKKVYIDIETWKTLPLREFYSGLAETVKHACIASHEFFKFLEDNAELIANTPFSKNATPILEHIAYNNVAIKAEVVNTDPNEENYRQVLNLGHTIGRALEAICDYKLIHGECVSIGLVLQAEIGLRFGYISDSNLKRIKSLLNRFKLPISIPTEITTINLVKKMYTDKKGKKGKIRMVFEHEIGSMIQFHEGQYSQPIEEEELIKLINDIRE
jgi:3-dehydroquinate synthase